MALQFLTLTLIRSHCRLDNYAIEDDLLTMYGASAENAALRYMGRTLESLYEEFGEVPEDVIQACCCRVETSYRYRGEITDRNLFRLPYAWEGLLLPYVLPDSL